MHVDMAQTGEEAYFEYMYVQSASNISHPLADSVTC